MSIEIMNLAPAFASWLLGHVLKKAVANEEMDPPRPNTKEKGEV